MCVQPADCEQQLVQIRTLRSGLDLPPLDHDATRAAIASGRP